MRQISDELHSLMVCVCVVWTPKRRMHNTSFDPEMKSNRAGASSKNAHSDYVSIIATKLILLLVSIQLRFDARELKTHMERK